MAADGDPVYIYIHIYIYIYKLYHTKYMSLCRFASKVAASFGLVHFVGKKYYNAALKFVECHIDIGSQYNEVIHAEDIALIGGLCALASFNRTELKEKVKYIQHSACTHTHRED